MAIPTEIDADGAAAPTSAPAAHPQRLGPFVLEAPIAAGGMGQVWAACHRTIGLPVAIKVLSGVVSAQSKAALWAEARAVARIDHPNVIRLLDVGEVPSVGARATPGAVRGDADGWAETEATPAETAWAATAYAAAVRAPDAGGSPFLVMERADGTLGDRLPLALEPALDALRAVLSALAAAHARGIVHRDVKPANVLRIGSRWVLADFGVAAAVDGVVGARSGTPLYMAPEQIVGDGAAQGPWTDLYAVGCMAYTLLTGRPPFPGPDRRAIIDGHRFGRPPPLPEALPAALRGWIEQLLAKDPARRFRCAADARSALDGGPTPVEFADDWREPPRELAFPLVGAGLGLYAHRQIPLIGRADAREALWSALGAVHRSGDMGLALVLGAPGIGKSRLVQWLTQRAAERGFARVVHQQGDAPLGRAVRRAMNLDDVPDDVLPTAVARALADAEPSPEEVQAIIRLVGERLVGPDAARPRAAAMAAWLGLWALERPVIWWVDDAHLAGDAIAAVEQCLRVDGGAGLPVLAVLSAREGEPEDRGTVAPAGAETLFRLGPIRQALMGLLQRPDARAVTLDPLPVLEARALVREQLHLDGALADALERRAAGHPGFVVRWVTDHVEQGELVPGPDGFRPASGAALHMPLDVAGVWRRRATSLAQSDAEQRLLELAAALGPEVDGAVWRRAGGPRADGFEQALRRRGALRDVPRRPGSWALTHGPLSEAIAAESVRAGRWAAINRDAAAALATAEDPDPGLLARLYHVGGQPEASVGPLLDAAGAALRRGAPGAALALLDTRAERLTGADPDGHRAELLRLELLRRLSRPDEALAVAERLWADPPADPFLRAAIREEWSAALRRRNRLDEAVALMQQAVAEARSVGDRSLISSVCTRLGRQLTFSCRFTEARPVLDEALAHAESDGHRADALYALSIWCCQTAQIDEAKAVLTEAHALHERLGNLHSASDCINQLGEVARASGDLDGAWALNAEAMTLARLAGVSLDALLLNHGLLALERADPAEARRLLRQATAGLVQGGNAMALPFAKMGRLHAAALLGDAEEWAAASAIEADLASKLWPEVPDMLRTIIELAEEVGFDAREAREARARLLAGG